MIYDVDKFETLFIAYFDMNSIIWDDPIGLCMLFLKNTMFIYCITEENCAYYYRPSPPYLDNKVSLYWDNNYGPMSYSNSSIY